MRIVLLVGLVAVLLAPAAAATTDPQVTVRLNVRPPWALSFREPWLLNGRPMAPGAYEVVPSAVGLQMRHRRGTYEAARGVLSVEGAGPASAAWRMPALNGRHYRGTLLFRGDTVSNVVHLQHYLYGVVAREIGGSAEPEALRAQAVVARTYAMAHAHNGTFDDTTAFQAYHGAEGETPAARAAVDATCGQVLLYDGRLAREVCYHSTCGGQTEANENVFMSNAIPYLRSVACASAAEPPLGGVGPDLVRIFPALRRVHTLPFPPLAAESGGTTAACAASDYFRWTVTFPPGQYADAEVLERTPAGRVLRLRVDNRTVSGDPIRRALTFRGERGRVRPLYSTSFELSRNGDTLVATGAGWGHGVGLCQWGARGMARAGGTWIAILERYFPGTVVGTL